MTRRDIATILLNRQNAGLSFILDSETRSKLTPEAFQEAMRLGWIVPAHEFDHICVSQDATKLAEMRLASVQPAIANDSVVCESKKEGIPRLEAFELHRGQTEFRPYGLPAELAEVAAIKAPDRVEIGTQVKVVDGGKTYTASVQSVKPSGKLVLSFPDNGKPAQLKPEYDASEVSFDTGEKPEAPKPVNPTAPEEPAPKSPTATSGGPKAPGLGESAISRLTK